MFEKSKQHLRILKKLKALRHAKKACPKGSEERKIREHAYLHLRDRYLDTVLGGHDTAKPAKGAATRRRRKFKHLGWGFVLRQVGMGIVMGIIRRPIQMIVPSILAFIGVKYFEPKLSPSPQCPHETVEMKAKLQVVETEAQVMRNKVDKMEKKIELLEKLLLFADVNKPHTVNLCEKINGLVPYGFEIKLDSTHTKSRPPESQGKFIPQQINKENPVPKKEEEFKPVTAGVKRVYPNCFVYKFNTSPGRMS